MADCRLSVVWDDVKRKEGASVWTTTIAELERHGACDDRLEHLRKAVRCCKCVTWGEEDEVLLTLMDILDYNGVDDVLWVIDELKPCEDMHAFYVKLGKLVIRHWPVSSAEDEAALRQLGFALVTDAGPVLPEQVYSAHNTLLERPQASPRLGALRRFVWNLVEDEAALPVAWGLWHWSAKHAIFEKDITPPLRALLESV